MSLTNKTSTQLNASLVKYLPELASDYATYPMHHERWYEPTEKGKKGEPCFVSSDTNVGVKLDYVYCKNAPYGPGYYSLLCKTSYYTLYSKIQTSCPTACCACSKAARKDYDEWDDVKRLIYARQVAVRPDDGQAAVDAISESKATSSAWYNGLQNEQLALNTVAIAAAI